MVKLFLIPTSLSNDISRSELLPYQLQQIHHLQHFIVETSKVARLHLKQFNLATPLQELKVKELNKHQQDLNTLITPLLEGKDIGLLSDCGMPAIADPGSQIVKLAHQHKATIIPLAGASSLLMALMASGVNGQSFAFNGYLPIEESSRKSKIRQLEDMVLKLNQSQIIIEAPFRNLQLLRSLIDNLNDKVTLAIAINLMQDNEQIISMIIKDWKKLKELPNIHKQEAVFVLGS